MADSRSVLFRLEEADKMLRKGEFPTARAIYVALLGDAPPEMQGAIQLRIDRVDELSAPGERGGNTKSNGDTSAQARAETAANEGRLDEAIAIYAEIIATRPDDQLARERLTELINAKSKGARGRPTPIRTVTAQDSANATAAGTQESGPLGRALHEGKGKAGHGAPAPAPAAPVNAPPATFDASAFGRPGSVVGFLNPALSKSQPPTPAQPPAPPPAMRPAQPPPPAQPQAAAPRPTPAPMQPPRPAAPPPAPVAAQPAPKPAAAPAPRPSSPLPADPVEMLREALKRVQSNRRSPSPFGPLAA